MIFWGLLGVVIALILLWVLKLVFFRPFNINHFFERVMLSFALANPEIMSMLRILEKVGIQAHNKKLNNESDAFLRKQDAKARRSLAILQRYNRDKLSPTEQLSYDVMAWYLGDIVAGQEFRYHDYPVNQLFGIQNQLPSVMASMHQLNNQRDAEYYIIRLSKFKVKFEQVLEGLKIREEKGIIPPLFVFEKVLAEMENFIATGPTENMLYTNIAEKLARLNLDSAKREDLLARTEQEIENTVYPAYKLLIDYFTHLKSKASTDAGVWKLPKGEKYYQYLLHHHTSTELSAEEIHATGLAEVSRIQGEMRAILSELGYSGKSPVEHMNELSQDPRFAYSDDDESRAQVLKDYQSIIEHIDANLDHLFIVRPKARVIVERVPRFKEKTAPGAYYNPPAMDGSRPGIFSANLLKLPRKYDMETLAFHEAIPGHHFQLAIAQELKGLPTFRRLVPFTAYAEGWALYIEKLVNENGLFSDKYSVLGYLCSELFRAVRLVVDTGIHHKRWTREQAIEYMIGNSALDPVDVVIEVERYIVMPGQATSYKVGELEMVRLREYVQEQLGEAFDIREFHDVVLKGGSLPLRVLDKIVREYVYEKQACLESSPQRQEEAS